MAPQTLATARKEVGAAGVAILSRAAKAAKAVKEMAAEGERAKEAEATVTRLTSRRASLHF